MSQKIIVDVRESDEYEAEHIPHSINIPLTKLHQIENYKSLFEGKTVCIMCKTGRRAGMAKATFDEKNMVCEVFQGGIEAWKKTNQPTNGRQNPPISIFRQVQIVVGFLVAIFAILGGTVSSEFAWVAAAFGLALGIAGLFGFCLLAEILQKMPWNRVS